MMMSRSYAFMLTFALMFIACCCCSAEFIEQVATRALKQDDDDGENSVKFLGFHTVAFMPYSCSDMSATTFEKDYGDGQGHRIYLVGGCTADQECVVDDATEVILYCFCPKLTNKTIYFTPATELWHEDAAAALRERYRHMAVRVGRYLWVLGGRDVGDNLITAVDRYDTVSDEWEFMFQWAGAVSDAAAWYANDLIYVVGGYDAEYNTLSQLVTINPGTGAVDSSSLPSMYIGRGDLQAAQFEDNEFWVVGGWNAATSDGFCVPSRDVEVFNSDTLQWRNESQLADGRGDLVLGNMGSGLFAVGGETKNQSSPNCSFSIPVRIVERRLDDNSFWNDEEDIPADLFRFSGASYRGGDSDDYSTDDYNKFTTAIYLFGGQGLYNEATRTYPVLNTTIKYIPTSTGSGGNSNKNNNNSNDDKGLDAGGIAGVVIAAIVIAVLVLAAVIALLEYKRRNHKLLQDYDGAPSATAAGSKHGRVPQSDDFDGVEMGGA